MAKLYQSLFDNNNIQIAINEIFSNDMSLIAGPDGITKQHFINTNRQLKLIKEVKKRLRRCAKLNYKIINNIVIYNLYDRIAQHCICRLIRSMLKSNISEHNYSFKRLESIKIPLSKICSVVMNSKNVYSIQFDFTQYFNMVSLDNILALVYEIGLHDKQVLSTIKYLLWPLINNGVARNFLDLELLLQNYSLFILDKWIENNVEFNSKTRNLHRDLYNHANNYVEWLIKQNKKPHAKYYRYNNDIIILTQTRSEQLYIYNQLCTFIQQKFNIKIASKLNYNQVDYLNFHIKKMKSVDNIPKINITPSNIKELHQQIKKLNFRNAYECLNSLQRILNLMNYYDIVNNFVWFLELLDFRIAKHTRRTGSCLKRIWNKEKKEYEYMFQYCKQEFKFSVWNLRRIFKISYKEYIIHPLWLLLRERLNNISIKYINSYQLHKWELWTKQKGLDYCTSKLLNPYKVHIHHKDGNRLNNKIDNLILINNNTHKLIHNTVYTDNKKIIMLRKKILKN